MYNLDITDNAEQDLENIISYIVEKLSAPVAASTFLDAVHDCYENLETNPHIYESCRDHRLKKEGYRRAVVKNYILVYKIDEEAKTVTIHRFFYGRQDYVSLI